MKIYIRSAACISPQDTFDKDTFDKDTFLSASATYSGNVLKAIEPDYKDIIDAKLSRRMSRILRMGVAAAMKCLEQAGIKDPGAVITGTAYGCLADTEIFLSRMTDQREEMLSPTAFIQSTHNTPGAQIALMLQCNNYNNTFVHGGLSFESALQDAIMLLRENAVNNVLAGSIEETTDISHDILSRFGLYKRKPLRNMELYSSNTKGTIAGEGVAFFLLSDGPVPSDYAQLDGVATLHKPVNTTETVKHITTFLEDHGITVADIDLVITGKNGDSKNDARYDMLEQLLFIKNTTINYKHLCGDYPTAISFAVWLAANIIKTQQIPNATGYKEAAGNKLKKVLICNNYLDYHSLILLSACG